MIPPPPVTVNSENTSGEFYALPKTHVFLQQPLQALIAGPANRQAAAVGQNRDAAVLRVQLHPRQPLDVDEVRPVDPDESPPVELALEIAKRLLLRDRFFFFFLRV